MPVASLTPQGDGGDPPAAHGWPNGRKGLGAGADAQGWDAGEDLSPSFSSKERGACIRTHPPPGGWRPRDRQSAATAPVGQGFGSRDSNVTVWLECRTRAGRGASSCVPAPPATQWPHCSVAGRGGVAEPRESPRTPWLAHALLCWAGPFPLSRVPAVAILPMALVAPSRSLFSHMPASSPPWDAGLRQMGWVQSVLQ